METYHKIITVWERDPDTKYRTLIEGRWATPELRLLSECAWNWTEKIDGTNIRIDVREDGYDIGGRTDRAQIPAFLLPRLDEIGERAVAADLGPMTLYGEGFGARIQKGGGNYISDGVDFVLFDVLCGPWLRREDVVEVAYKIGGGLQVIPHLGIGSLRKAVSATRRGFNSRWGDFPAEGLVLRPDVELRTRRGHRIIAKIKTRDFA